MSISFTDLTGDALAGLRSWLEQNPPAIPIGNILGYNQFVASTKQATVATNESTFSGTYTDLTTPGPTITGLPAGRYILFYSCQAAADQSQTIGGVVHRSYAWASVKYSSAEAADSDALVTTGFGSGSYQTMSGFKIVDLTDNTNTVTLRYKNTTAVVASIGAVFQNRNLVALRYATL